MKYHVLFIIFWKSSKIWNCHLLQILGGALWVINDIPFENQRPQSNISANSEDSDENSINAAFHPAMYCSHDAVSDQILHYMLTEISIKISGKMKNSTNTPQIEIVTSYW